MLAIKTIHEKLVEINNELGKKSDTIKIDIYINAQSIRLSQSKRKVSPGKHKFISLNDSSLEECKEFVKDISSSIKPPLHDYNVTAHCVLYEDKDEDEDEDKGGMLFKFTTMTGPEISLLELDDQINPVMMGKLVEKHKTW